MADGSAPNALSATFPAAAPEATAANHDCSPTMHRSALGTGDVTGSAELKQVTGHWSDSRSAVTGVSPVTR